MVSKKIEVFSRKCIVLELPAYNLQKLYIYILQSVTDNQNYTATWQYHLMNTVCDSSDHSNKSMRRFVCKSSTKKILQRLQT